MLSFFPRDVLDEILNLIESVSEGFPTYSCNIPLQTVLEYKLSLEVTCLSLTAHVVCRSLCLIASVF